MSIRIDGTNTTANPGITGGDADTGLQFGTDEVSIVTGGTDRATVDSSGRLLVGTSSESGNARQVVRGNTGSATGAGVFDIGLGTTRPGSAGTALGYLRFTSTSNTGSNYHYAAIHGETDGTSSSDTDIPGRLVFSTTADGASSPTEVMRINSLQQVAIGGAGGNRKFNVESQNNSVFLKAPSNGSCNDMVSIQCGTNAGDTTTRYINFRRQNGTIIGFVGMNGASAVTFSPNASDYRLKENVVPLPNSIDRLKALRPVRFNFIESPGEIFDGFIAHECTDIPKAVLGEKDAVDDEGKIVPQSVDVTRMIPLLTAALQEALTRIEALEAEVTALKGGAS